MAFVREFTIVNTPDGDEANDAVMKLDADVTNLFTSLNTVNTLTSQKIPQTEKGSSNGVCPLNTDSKIESTYLSEDARTPVGTVVMYAGETAPVGWFECNGAEYVIATYPKLFEAIGYLWGGTGLNFKIPDMRGYFPRGWDHGVGNDPDRMSRSGGDHVGSSQTDALGPHVHGLDQYSESASTGNESRFGSGGYNPSRANVSPNTGTETRPKNKYFMFIIKYDY